MNPPRSTSSEPFAHYRADSVCTRDDNAGFLIKLVSNSLNRMLDLEMAPLGLTAMQWRPLAMIATGRADTPAELARLINVDTGAMTRTLDRLEAKGLLRRVRSQEDRRVIKIELTPEGLAKAREIPAYIAKVLNHHLRGFSTEEVAQLQHMLRRIIANGSVGG
ncbi:MULTISPECIES: MarR family winged helix-turn-helix transcriptional regulator [Bordetella]|uniref:MarR family transcriptional regulator n=1 Tax=Bordetella genomosp. 6 TaxID=463024 RepID=A0ABX4FBG2_9BORD|nr:MULTISPECIES: MarR family transcriptional regulator [Bordetella]AOB27634.1 MarR family transcriptional regulator [Bordetella bronchiseptica]AZW44955.1 MarR family transcriptional regulator [Bordetella bronchiseptica]KCV62943.1 MarR family protein [Bordetella bronchiseptica 99-R-0433]OZI76916.1 MarR family transcriptional regulator [Bordetella genomosp. 6]